MIGDTGGIGSVLEAHVYRGTQSDLGPALPALAIPGKVRFGGHLGNGCRKHANRICIQLTVGTEIENRPDVLAKIEKQLQDPCSALTDPAWWAANPARVQAFGEFFQCDRPADRRTARFVEIQVVTEPIAIKPEIVRIHSYRIPPDAPLSGGRPGRRLVRSWS